MHWTGVYYSKNDQRLKLVAFNKCKISSFNIKFNYFLHSRLHDILEGKKLFQNVLFYKINITLNDFFQDYY